MNEGMIIVSNLDLSPLNSNLEYNYWLNSFFSISTEISFQASANLTFPQSTLWFLKLILTWLRKGQFFDSDIQTRCLYMPIQITRLDFNYSVMIWTVSPDLRNPQDFNQTCHS